MYGLKIALRAGGKLGTENESLGNPAATVEERVNKKTFCAHEHSRQDVDA